MELFEDRRRRFLRRFRFFLPILLLLLLCGFFYAGIRITSKETYTNEQKTLEQALLNSAVHAYSLNGCYPESLDQFLEEYGIHYDPDRFVVEYIPSGSNLFPSIDVIPLREQKGALQ